MYKKRSMLVCQTGHKIYIYTPSKEEDIITQENQDKRGKKKTYKTCINKEKNQWNCYLA